MVIPRLISSEWVSVHFPESALTRVVFPWSTCPMSPMLSSGWGCGCEMVRLPMRGQRRGRFISVVVSVRDDAGLCMRPFQESGRGQAGGRPSQNQRSGQRALARIFFAAELAAAYLV